MIRQKKIWLARHSGYRFTHWLLAACLLGSSAIVTTAQNAPPTILATGQGNAGNIIVDLSRVYWINATNSTVSSIDKLYGGVVRIHSPAGVDPVTGFPARGGDIVQDNLNLYFASATGSANGVFPPGRL